MDSAAPVWLITGCSTGFGRDLARAVLSRGNRAVVTARNPVAVAEFATAYPDTALTAALDVTTPGHPKAVVERAEATFGRIDVLVNNAGYGYLAAVEEGEDDAVRAMFEANVFGLIAVTQAVLPGMRAPARAHRQYLVGRRPRRPAGCRLLQRQQVRGGRPVGSAGQGGGAAGHQGDRRGAGLFPHRLGGPLAQDAKTGNCRLCRHRRRPPRPDPGIQRQAAG